MACCSTHHRRGLKKWQCQPGRRVLLHCLPSTLPGAQQVLNTHLLNAAKCMNLLHFTALTHQQGVQVELSRNRVYSPGPKLPKVSEAPKSPPVSGWVGVHTCRLPPNPDPHMTGSCRGCPREETCKKTFFLLSLILGILAELWTLSEAVRGGDDASALQTPTSLRGVSGWPQAPPSDHRDRICVGGTQELAFIPLPLRGCTLTFESCPSALWGFT